MEKQKLLEGLASQIDQCTRCELYKSSTHAVPGVGLSEAKIVFVGEAPGFHEDQQGKPFVGNAGKFLDYLFGKIGLERKNVFITNVIKHRPPDNRDPFPQEIAACTHWLDKQLAILSPKIIITLGKWSLNYFLSNKKISEVHGQTVKIKEKVILPMYHPAAALRNGAIARVLEEDFLNNRQLLLDPDKASEIKSLDAGGQQSLF